MTPESKVLRAIELALGAEPDLLLLRNNVGVAVHADGRRVRYGLGNGSPDLVGMLSTRHGHAAWFCLEVKAPGGRLSRVQVVRQASWRRFGAFVFVVTDVYQALHALDQTRTNVGRRLRRSA